MNMNTAHFQNLPETICRHLEQARRDIRIAVCWFSRQDIFEVVLARLRAGVQVSLLLEYDNRNICDDGLDFQKFIRLGGQLYAYREAGLMHHKFALVDERTLLTGSYNWTYNANAENLLVSADPALVAGFQAEFRQMKAAARRIFQIRREEVRVFSAFPLFENTRFYLTDLRKKVSGGAGVWVVRTDKMKAGGPLLFRENQLPFDAEKLLQEYWTAYRMWNQELFDQEAEAFCREAPATLRRLYLWMKRMKTGDIVLAVKKGPSRASVFLIAVGIVQSEPQPFPGKEFSSYRDVQWLKIMEETPVELQDRVSAQAVARFRGSALRVLQEVFQN